MPHTVFPQEEDLSPVSTQSNNNMKNGKTIQDHNDKQGNKMINKLGLSWAKLRLATS